MNILTVITCDFTTEIIESNNAIFIAENDEDKIKIERDNK